MRFSIRSKTSIPGSLLILAVLLSSLVSFGNMGNVSTAHAAAATKTTLLNLQFLGTTIPSTQTSPTTITPPSVGETPPDRGIDNDDPHLAISGSAPPLQPPPAGTRPPNPRSNVVTTNNPGFRGFNGTSQADQRLAGTGIYTNTEFSFEPPDQGLCVSNKFELDSVNSGFTIHSLDGKVVSGTTQYNQFFGLTPQIIRSNPLVFGDFSTDPKCYFDAATQRWFMTVLELDTNSVTGAFSGPTRVLLAVSQTSDPTGAWGRFSINTTNDGKNGTPSRPNCPCIGDQPLLGADTNGFYFSTNEFPVFTNGFNGALIYAISKNALEQAAQGKSALPGVVLIDASQELVPFGGLSYSIQPATQPPPAPILGRENNGTEYFLSALDFNSTVDNRIATWALTNTRSLNKSAPDLHLTFTVIRSQLYGQPFLVTQKDGPRPYGDGVLHQPIGKLRSNDDRMNQVVYAAGVLWSGLNTVVQKPGEAVRTGVAFFGVVPFWRNGTLNAVLIKSGYIAVDVNSVMYPSIGVNVFGQGAISFSVAGPGTFPSAAYMPISLARTGDVHIAQAGAGPEDGFTCYPPVTNGRCRWGDYSAAVAAPDGSIWLAIVYIPNTPRTLIANWGTFISRVANNE